jgi:O-antigen/teichoic acid export membrane protein
MVSVGCWLIMAIYGQPIIGLLFGPAYARYADVAACLMLAAGLRNFSILLGRALAAMRRFRTGLLLRTATIVMLVALLPGWVDWLGLMGAAWAVILSWAVGVVLSLAAVLHALKKPRQNTRD